ncbi:alpha-L-fucosidase [Nitrospirillum viridazoti]|uniref:alpha-L-fucosidase n=1 Tax=Nitrospirillum amazonense TaxID=28077 RepID=A0A560I2C6_9PROT|nr:alpha-L-fucosidase [Nitrospirillum amazonense]TWB53062.1 alpha-L-fucosidase [Nitrospirillum amazonense]
MVSPTRRDLVRYAGAVSALTLSAAPAAAKARADAGPFQPTWESLAAGYQAPTWFRDAKFGIWAHWGPQCAPEFGDWYARRMYMQGDPSYEHHVKTYGHPTQFGFMELINRWKAERWDPEELTKLYKAAGAKYLVSMACHHDNFDNFDSRHHAWNATRVGPGKDIVGGWAAAARKHGLRFGVSNHASHAWHWYQTAYGYDATGPRAGQRYDAFRLTKADGAGTWWRGLDPQELYTGRNIVIPDGITDQAAMTAWHQAHDGVWDESVPPNRAFAETWLKRCQDLMDRYQPDLVYFDDTGLPLGDYGLRATAHYYNQSVARKGAVDVVVNCKELTDLQRRAVVADIERGFSDHIVAEPWQTDTCLGDWHYSRPLYERKGYLTAHQVVQRLVDVVSKNGCLLLNVPVRSDGTIDELERGILQELVGWMAVNSEGIFDSRPWKTYGEGPTEVAAGKFNEAKLRPFTAEDIRFTVKGDTLYAYAQEWPAGKSLTIRTLTPAARPVQRVDLLGGGALEFKQTDDGVSVTLPDRRPTFTPAFRIR